MKNEEFDKLLDLYLKGRLSVAQKKELEKQLDEFHISGTPPEFNREHEDGLWKRIASKTGHTQTRRRKGKMWAPIAAALIVAMVAVSLALLWNSEVTQLANKRILDDGTIVWLKGSATLDQAGFSLTDRQVTLTGEALFEVAKNPQHPFIIHCGRYVARVLGTSFNIKTSDSSVELTVLTGQVKLSSLTTDSSVVVSQHEHVIFTESQGTVAKLSPSKDDVTAVTAHTQYDMHFEDTPMDEIVHRVEGKFDVEIDLENKELGNCMISADFTDQSLPITLFMISEALGFEYEIHGKHIVIRGTGCTQ